MEQPNEENIEQSTPDEVPAEILKQINEGPVYSELSKEQEGALRETIRKVQEENGLE